MASAADNPDSPSEPSEFEISAHERLGEEESKFHLQECTTSSHPVTLCCPHCSQETTTRTHVQESRGWACCVFILACLAGCMGDQRKDHSKDVTVHCCSHCGVELGRHHHHPPTSMTPVLTATPITRTDVTSIPQA